MRTPLLSAAASHSLALGLLLTLAAPAAAQAQGPPPPAPTAPTVLWDRTFGGSVEDRLNVVRPTADGGYLLGGFSSSGATGDKTQPGRGGLDFWVVKVDSGGTKQWDRTFGGGNEDRLVTMEATPDGGYLLAGFSNSSVSGDKTDAARGGFDYWVVKLDSAGLKQWDHAAGSVGDDRLTGMSLTADGGCILAGQCLADISGDKTDSTRGGFDYWIVKLDSSGAKQWDRALGGGDNDLCNAVQATRDGGYVVGGFSYSGASADKSEANRGVYDYWIVKLDSAGTRQWDRTMGGGASDNLTSLRQTSDGGYLAGGFSESAPGGDKTEPSRGGYDNWVVKLDSAGAKQWDHTYGGDGYDSLNGLIETLDGGYLFGSQSNSGANGDKSHDVMGAPGTPDFWVMKVDSAGVKEWDGTYGGAADDVLTSLRQTPDGGYILGGFSNSGVSGTKSQPSRGDFDFWIVRLGATTPVPTATAGLLTPAALAVYPNPARTGVVVQLPTAAPRTGLHLRLLDATGRVVWQQVATAPDGQLRADFGARPAGLYLLRLEGADGYVGTQRLLLD